MRMLITAARLALALGLAVPLTALADCEAVSNLDLPGVTVDSIETVDAGSFLLEGGREGPRLITDLPAFCRVIATLSPVTGSEIHMELWLPDPAAWNGRYLAVGNGGFAASISTAAMMDPLRRGYATSSTDTGHSTPGGDFALDEVKLTDFAYRAVHQMAQQSKQMIRVFYDRSADYSLFSGCSTGGRQALAAAQRYPTDFDGIVAGAPAGYTTHLQGQQLWMSRVGRRPGATVIPPEKFQWIQDAVIAACDMNDGVADLVLESPPGCNFDPQSLACNGPGDSACLLPGEITTLTKLYQGPTTAGGSSIFPGSALGSEGGWAQMTGPQPLSLASDVYRYMVFPNEDWNFEDFNVKIDVDYAAEVVGETMNAIDPDLGPLIANGGKLLIYHGWADPGITPYSTVRYYESVIQTLGDSARESVRLFMVPGMGHCGGGEGPGTFDAVGIIDAWLTSGSAPDQILASRSRAGEIDRTRPLCPYPQTAVYMGSGSTDRAKNFQCLLP